MYILDGDILAMSKRTTSVDVRLPDGFSVGFESEFRVLLDKLCSNGGFQARYLADEVFSKYLDNDKVPAEVRGTAAVHKWISAEQRNLKTNHRLLLREDVNFGFVTADAFYTRVRGIIARILGPLDYPACLHYGDVTNGASTRVRRSPRAAIDKLTGRIEMSESAIKHWLAFASGSRLSALPVTVVEESALFTVPKKSDIDRVACKEPEGNMYLQRSLGEVIRHRLRRWGINLNDQKINQNLASRAVAEGLATVDLSSASDTISRQLVINLLPFDWWSLLDDLRVKATLLPDGTPHYFEMFSSMGNGFTFELESLIFYSMARAVEEVVRPKGPRRPISVYGDDIILSADLVGMLDVVMSYSGFTMNRKKTHSKGPFRESCGGHYWKGQNVTPFYIRRAVCTLPDLINVLNRLLEWDGRGWGFFTTEEAFRFWEKWSRYVPRRFWGGVSVDDPTALVTGHAPRMRIVPVMRPMRSDESGRLLLWFLRSAHGKEDLAVDPRQVIGFRAETVVSRGELTSWRPGIAWSPWRVESGG